MTVMSSRIPAAVDYLVTTITSTLGANAHVFDGPPANGTELELNNRVWIGYSPVSPDLPAVTGDQDFAALGARSRNENFAIVCAVEYWDGSGAFTVLRAAAFALLRQIETLLRGTGGNPGDCTLGGAVQFAGLSGGIEVHQGSTTEGPSVLLQFHITCRARLTS